MSTEGNSNRGGWFWALVTGIIFAAIGAWLYDRLRVWWSMRSTSNADGDTVAKVIQLLPDNPEGPEVNIATAGALTEDGCKPPCGCS